MNRVVITKALHGICHMQVCAEHDASDEEILNVCNLQNPSGTTNGWGKVIRHAQDEHWLTGSVVPVLCANDPTRLHILVAC